MCRVPGAARTAVRRRRTGCPAGCRTSCAGERSACRAATPFGARPFPLETGKCALRGPFSPPFMRSGPRRADRHGDPGFLERKFMLNYFQYPYTVSQTLKQAPRFSGLRWPRRGRTDESARKNLHRRGAIRSLLRRLDRIGAELVGLHADLCAIRAGPDSDREMSMRPFRRRSDVVARACEAGFARRTARFLRALPRAARTVERGILE